MVSVIDMRLQHWQTAIFCGQCHPAEPRPGWRTSSHPVPRCLCAHTPQVHPDQLGSHIYSCHGGKRDGCTVPCHKKLFTHQGVGTAKALTGEKGERPTGLLAPCARNCTHRLLSAAHAGVVCSCLMLTRHWAAQAGCTSCTQSWHLQRSHHQASPQHQRSSHRASSCCSPDSSALLAGSSRPPTQARKTCNSSSSSNSHCVL